MRWSESLLVVALPVALLVEPSSHADNGDRESVRAALSAREAALTKTDGLLATKLEARTKEFHRRVRSLHRAMSGTGLRVWFDRDERFKQARRRAAGKRILQRDRAELRLLRDEIASARRGRKALEAMQKRAGAIPMPENKSLLSPVRGTVVFSTFGEFKGKRSRTNLTRRGIDLLTKVGGDVRAPDDGKVRFAGKIRGLGDAILIQHENLLTLIGRVADIAVKRGDSVTRGQRLGSARERRVYFEVRLDIGGGGHPVDPEPLITNRAPR